MFARRGSGSYYTPDDLVGLIIRDTVGPLVSDCMEAFSARVHELETGTQSEALRLASLAGIDPAERILNLRYVTRP